MLRAETLDGRDEGDPAGHARDDAPGRGGPDRVPRFVLRRVADLGKLLRYGSTSLLALVISEVTLVLLSANSVLGATSAALVANLSGMVPSYLLSRYWIWSRADRRRPGRQIGAYWLISVVSMLISSVVIGEISHHTPRARLLHLCILSSSYLVISLVLWVAKFIVYERTIFRADNRDLFASVSK